MTGPPGTPPITAGYEAETRALCRQGAEAACLLAILLVPPFALLDYIVCGQCFSLFLGMRLGCVVIMGLIRSVLRSRLGEVHAVALGVLVAGVVGLMEQILRNLIANAVKFTEHGGIRIEACVGGVECLAGFTFIDDATHRRRSSDARSALVFVRDSGIGIRQGDVAALAADFQQVDPEAAARYGGTGLGLSISKKLVRLLGGRIAVRSRHREGSEFVLCLPVARPPAARAFAPAELRVRVPSAA